MCPRYVRTDQLGAPTGCARARTPVAAAARIAASPRDVRLAGPTIGIHTWFPDLPQCLTADPRVRVVTLQRYPVQNFVSTASPVYPSIGNLLSDAASRELVDGIAPYVLIAHARHLSLTIDEMDTLSARFAAGRCRSFASALWSMDALSNITRVGRRGQHAHVSQSNLGAFHFWRTQGRWQAFVSP